MHPEAKISHSWACKLVLGDILHRCWLPGRLSGRPFGGVMLLSCVASRFVPAQTRSLSVCAADYCMNATSAAVSRRPAFSSAPVHQHSGVELRVQEEAGRGWGKKKEEKCIRCRVVFLHVWITFLRSCTHVILCGTTQGDVKMEGSALAALPWERR